MEKLWDHMIDYGIATEAELSLVTSINGYNEQALKDVLYCRTGYRSLEQIEEN